MEKQVYDVAVVGGGPAGLSAALTARVRNKSVVIFEHMGFSAKLQRAAEVPNYLGLPNLSGKELMERMAEHCLAAGPELVKEKVTQIFPGEVFTLLTPQDVYEAKTVILAIGVSPAELLAGEKGLLGQGVSYCATCDGMLYREKEVAVVAYAAEAEHEAVFLSEICRKVFYFPQYKPVGSLPPSVQICSGKPKGVASKEEHLVLEHTKGSVEADGIFILRETDPVENLLAEVELCKDAIKVSHLQKTSVPGVFAAGDCTGKPWQITVAVGEGNAAAHAAIAYLAAKEKA
ncbi:MAG: NAD(P)/FAD-dependent oxidoreductase [Anaeromusa sp.]|uniref:NAD(P)/FAD-dependent oxidoreductase n=1 Tax=Anaeromusa sp. TaxID=1872520 RepID=UPI002B1FD443|nr:NAD(P)/FAD-dependent oxidoreductase [Anaeromusa sp.]MEA4836566.1 NAD(P)/FAD-dependent oxidoreductase [Anaeromusa sp.]